MKMSPSTLSRLMNDSSEEEGVWHTMARLSFPDRFMDLATRWNKARQRYQFVIAIAHKDDEDDFIWLGTKCHDEASRHYVRTCSRYLT